MRKPPAVSTNFVTTLLDGHNYLRIQLLSYDKPTEGTERYYFIEMSTLQATTLIDENRKIIFSELYAYTDNNEYLDKETTRTFITNKDFNSFFIEKPQYYIHNCEIEFENGLKLNSHDDGEVSIQFSDIKSDFGIIETIFDKYNLNRKLIDILKSKPGYYLTIDKQSNITGNYKNFDDYLKNGNK